MSKPIIAILVCLTYTQLISCNRNVSEDVRSEIYAHVLRAQLDTMYTNSDRYKWDRRVLFVWARDMNDDQLKSVKDSLRDPFIAIRTDTADIVVTKGMATTKDGRSFEYTEKVRDRVTNTPVIHINIDSLRISWRGVASVYVTQVDFEGSHFQGTRWWLSQRRDSWGVDSTMIDWIN